MSGFVGFCNTGAAGNCIGPLDTTDYNYVAGVIFGSAGTYSIYYNLTNTFSIFNPFSLQKNVVVEVSGMKKI